MIRCAPVVGRGYAYFQMLAEAINGAIQLDKTLVRNGRHRY
jgi:hypothetical protein